MRERCELEKCDMHYLGNHIAASQTVPIQHTILAIKFTLLLFIIHDKAVVTLELRIFFLYNLHFVTCSKQLLSVGREFHP